MIILSLPGYFLLAQEEEVSETSEPKFTPSHIRVGLDIVGIGELILLDRNHRFELQADVDFGRYFAVAEFGREFFTSDSKDYAYDNQGNFYRLGVDYNFIPYNPERNMIFGGLRYARSNFNEEVKFTQNSNIWGDSPISRENESISANWFEIVVGMKVRLFSNLYSGFTTRIKFIKNIDHQGSFTPFQVPGFGKNEKSANLGFNYYFFYRFGLREKAVPKRPEG
ncbi:MAG TPA: DUF6048 family protein [Cyclobacteriaceae bacterium]